MRKLYVLLTAPLLMFSLANDDPAKNRVAGTPVDCLSDIDAQAQPRVVDATTIAYSRTDKRIWVTHPEGVCPSLRPMQTLIVERRGARLCRGDRFRTIQATSSVPSGVCHFGAFTPLDKAS